MPGALFAALGAVAVVSLAGTDVIDPAVRLRAQVDGRVAVLVALRDPEPGAADARTAIAHLQSRVLGQLPPGALDTVQAFRTVPGFAARIAPAALAYLARDPNVVRVDLDPSGRAAAGDNIAQIRADRVHARRITGEGVTIAVVDGGIDATHPDLAEALTEQHCFCRAGTLRGGHRGACCPDGTAEQAGFGSAATTAAHGTHVAGIALSRGRIGPVGVAPGADLVAVRVLDERDEGFVSDWIAALDWLAAERPDVRVVNMSLVSDALYRGDCGHCTSGDGCAATRLLGAVIERLHAGGTLVFAAAGNDGRAQLLAAPACVAAAVAVGAVDGADTVASFSNGGALLDLLAPGVGILSDDSAGGTAVLSGTSMAVPHAAGAAALVLSVRPGFGAADVESALRASGVPIRDPRTRRVLPRIDAFAAVRAARRGAELEGGGGSGSADCLLEWSVVPPSIVARRGWPVASCHDNDPLCDADRELGRCTFRYAPCFNMRDPALRACVADEPLVSMTIRSPPVGGAAGSVDRINGDALTAAIPPFPFGGGDTCTAPISFIVERPSADRSGVAHLRASVRTVTRRDYDHLVFECLPP
jgi:subtilisin family serine protease